MFLYDKLGDRDFMARTMMVLARMLCGYRNPNEPLKRVRCDCKYGIAEHPDNEVLRHHSEQSGCPELNSLEEFIRSIPKKEWERLYKRLLKQRERESKKLSRLWAKQNKKKT